MGDSDDRHRRPPLARVHLMPSGLPREDAGLEPSLRVRRGRVVELDGVRQADFDATDEFVARHGLALDVAREVTRLDDLTFARMLVHPSVPRDQLLRLGTGMTPGMVAASVGHLRPAELRMATEKLSAPGPSERVPEIVAVDPGSPWSTALMASWHAGHGVTVRVAHRAGDAGDERKGTPLYAAARRAVLLRATGVRGAGGGGAGDGPRPEALIAMLVDLETGLADLAATFGSDAPDPGPHALRRRAVAAESLGWVHLARTLERAAELTAYDESEVRRICDLLDGAGATLDRLRDVPTALAEGGAHACSHLVRGAVEFYDRRPSSR